MITIDSSPPGTFRSVHAPSECTGSIGYHRHTMWLRARMRTPGRLALTLILAGILLSGAPRTCCAINVRKELPRAPTPHEARLAVSPAPKQAGSPDVPVGGGTAAQLPPSREEPQEAMMTTPAVPAGGDSPAPLSAPAAAGRHLAQATYASCLAIKLSGAGSTSGQYTITPTGSASALSVYCDMSTDGGGYTYYACQARSKRATFRPRRCHALRRTRRSSSRTHRAASTHLCPAHLAHSP
jgi:hypothetical protein